MRADSSGGHTPMGRRSSGQGCRTKGWADHAMPRVLVIDDDIELCDLTAQYLETEGFATEAVHTGLEGVDRALSDEHCPRGVGCDAAWRAGVRSPAPDPGPLP